MSVISFDLAKNTVKKGRIEKKVTDYSKYKIKTETVKLSKMGDINLLNPDIESQISDGIIFSNQESGLMIYKFGAKRITQKLVSFKNLCATNYLKMANLKHYSYWVPDLYFVIYGSVDKLSVFSPDFQHAPLSNIYSKESSREIFGKTLPNEVVDFIYSKTNDTELYKVCIGGSLNYLGNLSNWKEKMEKFESIVNTFVSSSGNSDLTFKAPLARNIYERYTNVTMDGNTSVHGVLCVYTELHRAIANREMYNVWKNSVGSNVPLMMEKVRTFEKCVDF